MISPTTVSWLSVYLLLVTIVDLSVQRHAVASSSVNLQAEPADLDLDVDKRRFLFGRRNVEDAGPENLWNGRVGGLVEWTCRRPTSVQVREKVFGVVVSGGKAEVSVRQETAE